MDSERDRATRVRRRRRIQKGERGGEEEEEEVDTQQYTLERY